MRLRQSPAPQLEHDQSTLRRDRARAHPRPRGRIAQTGLALDQKSPQPFTRGRGADPVFGARHGRCQLMFNHVPDQILSTNESQSGILVNLHPVPPKCTHPLELALADSLHPLI